MECYSHRRLVQNLQNKLIRLDLMSLKQPTVVGLNYIVTMLLALFVSTALQADDLWEVVRNEQGIKISLSKVSESSYKMFRGEVMISAQANTVMSALLNDNSCSQWRYHCKTFISLGDDYHLMIQDLPWPISDRFVITQNILINAATLQISHVPLSKLSPEQASNLPEHDGMIEMKEYSGFWKVEQSNSDEVKVIFQIQANPAGSIPALIINNGVVNNPFNSLLNLRKHIATLSNLN